MKKLAKIAGLAALLSISMGSIGFAGEWKQDSKGWWYQKDDGSYYKNEWQWIDGNHDGVSECYCFDADGYMMSNVQIDSFQGINADGAWTIMGPGVHEEYFVTFTPVKANDNGAIPDYSGTYVGEWKEISGIGKLDQSTYQISYDAASKCLTCTEVWTGASGSQKTYTGNYVYSGTNKYGDTFFEKDPTDLKGPAKSSLSFDKDGKLFDLTSLKSIGKQP